MHSHSARAAKPVYAFRLTPAEWRSVIQDETFLKEPGNSYQPRRLMGVPVEIVPDQPVVIWR